MTGIIPTTKVLKKLKITILITGGAGTATTSIYFRHLLKHLIIEPTTSTTSYKFRLTESDGTIILDRTNAITTGRLGVIQEIPLFGTITISFSSVSADEDIDVTLYYAEL